MLDVKVWKSKKDFRGKVKGKISVRSSNGIRCHIILYTAIVSALKILFNVDSHPNSYNNNSNNFLFLFPTGSFPIYTIPNKLQNFQNQVVSIIFFWNQFFWQSSVKSSIVFTVVTGHLMFDKS